MAVIDTASILLRANRYSGSGDWLDESGNGHDATLVNAPSHDGSKFTLTGTEYFTLVDNAVFDATITDELTLVMVVEAIDPTPAAIMRPFDNKLVGSNNAGYQFTWNTTGTLQLRIADGTDPATTGTVTPGAGVHTIALRITARTQMSVILDGTAGTVDTIGAIGDASPGNTPTIGRGSDFDGQYFIGDVYGFAFWETALSDADTDTAGDELVASASGGGNLLLLGVG